FNRLAMANERVGNYAGCTVEKKTASVLDGTEVAFELTDLPGLYSLKPNSLDEEVALKHLEEKRGQSLVVFVLDGNNLEQELILPLMLKERGYRMAIAVNMMDEVRANKKILNLAGMTELAGVSFFPVAAKSGEGVESLRKYLVKHEGEGTHGYHRLGAEEALSDEALLLLHRQSRAQARRLNALNQGPKENLLLERDARFDRVLLNRVFGPILFFATMFVLFQGIFTWAVPLSDGVEGVIGILQRFVQAEVSPPILASLLSDGLLAGVGAVLVFVPQIGILFLMIGALEYSGYLPRVAYMVDRLMKPYGLDGKVFIPLLSSVACAVPGIMATRTIESERTRLTTIMISPLMTCSARLPVYTLLISTFIPNRSVGIFSLPGLVMFGMYALGVVVALGVALVLHKLDFKKRRHLVDFIHLPHYRVPNWPELARYVWLRIYAFLRKAGTIIAAMSILLWLLLTFPKSYEGREALQAKVDAAAIAAPAISGAAESEKSSALLAAEDNLSAADLEHSFGGQVGHALEPVFRPVGYDWRLTIGILASLAAREVFVATLGTVFALGTVEEHTEGLSQTLLSSKRPDGAPAYTLATCLSLLVFFAFSLQCVSTIGVARRETNSWKIPLIMFTYMFALAYGSAFVVFQVTSRFL
ncbi:MAG: ferrous iron transporter B, partial [Proteobacteria bacterium]